MNCQLSRWAIAYRTNSAKLKSCVNFRTPFIKTFLIKSCIIVNSFLLQTGTTALFFAAQGGFLDVIQLLLDNKASVDSLSVVI